MAVTATKLSLVVGVSMFFASLAADAQPTGKVYRVGYLASGSANSSPRFVEAFRDGLREFGWIEGQNVVIDYRYGEGRFDRLPELAADLIRLKVDVIVAVPTPSTVAAKNATGTTPIVMLNAAQPVELGLIASFARPGGNVTGVSWPDLEIMGKQVELLKETLPKVRLVAVLWNPGNPAAASAIRQVKAMAGSGLQLRFLEARGPNQFDGAFAAMAKERADALLVIADGLFSLHRGLLADLAAKNRLPSVHGLSEDVEAGALMSYGPSRLASFRRAASFVDKTLRGAKPADLAVEQPTTFELVINLKTAKRLNLMIPRSVLLRADQVIE